MLKALQSLHLNNRLFHAVGVLVLLFILAYVLSDFIIVPKALFLVFLAILLTDLILLLRVRTGLKGERLVADKLSNGDENTVTLTFKSFYSFPVKLRVFDELPHQFQKRDLEFTFDLKAGEPKTLHYYLRPVKRGEYSFGAVNALVSSPVGFLTRRFRFSNDKLVPVYPSYLQMRKYELLAIHNRLTETGIKKIRKIGNNQEFELIKEYVSGDDIRTINWKATARKGSLMVNHYQDERSQQVYSLIDKGRVMQMPFNGMSLLDYAINTALVISNIAVKKFDKAGLITFQDKIGTMLPAARKNNQMAQILEVLYNQKTAYRETDYSVVHAFVRQKISHRSLLLLFTNFETLSSMERQLPYLKSLALRHVVVVIFFENTEIKSLLEEPAESVKEIYLKAIAEKFSYEKKQIVKELKRHGIYAVLTPPEKLSINTINMYLELKARGTI
jgi:uncharacterized protein (DUF58 family)